MLFPFLVHRVLLNISVPHTTALLRPAPDIVLLIWKELSSHFALSFFLFPITLITEISLSFGISSCTWAFSSGVLRACGDYLSLWLCTLHFSVQSSAYQSCQTCFQKAISTVAQMESVLQKGSSFSKYIPMVKHWLSFDYLLIFLKALFFFFGPIFISYSIGKC